MKLRLVIILYLTLTACHNSNLQKQQPVTKSIHFPDTTNNWYAKLFDYPEYVKKIEITKQLNLRSLEADTSTSEIRIWTIGSNYNPQSVILLECQNNIWTISRLNYFLNFDSAKTKVDSISFSTTNKRQISRVEFNDLDTATLWKSPSQSEMKNGSSYGCLDGYSLFVEMSTPLKYKFVAYVCPDMHVTKDVTFQNIVNFQQKVINYLGKK